MLSGAELYDKATTVGALDGLRQSYDGTAKPVTVTTIPPRVSVGLTYDGAINAPTNVGTYIIIATVNNLTYQGSVTNRLVITPKALPIVLTSKVQADGTLQLAFTNSPGAAFTVLGTTNLSLPLGDWMALGSPVEIPLGSGQFHFIIPQTSGNPQFFYLIQSQ